VTSARVVFVTCPDEECAVALARSLVEKRLAACVNVVQNVRSIYRWEDQVQQDTEVLLVVKTRVDRVAALTSTVQQEHPYDVPEVVVLPVEQGSRAYLSWIDESLGGKTT
jgi:periplasmic divalent cation tolerance protein